MKKVIYLLFFMISHLALSQISSIVINQETKEGIPFVNIWVENENKGTTSNLNGEFVINASLSATLVFSAIGFETTYVSVGSIEEYVTLKPVVNQLDEIVIKPKLGDKELKIGSFKKRKVNSYNVSGAKPWISARFFEYKEIYDEIGFLNKLKILTKSDIKNSQFNIRLYKVGEDGTPSTYLHDENIIGVANKGKNYNEIDISHLNIRFPSKGLFVALEWLIIDSNRYMDFGFSNNGESITEVFFAPTFGNVYAATNENSWFFSKGKWEKISGMQLSDDDNELKYMLLAIELTLTN